MWFVNFLGKRYLFECLFLIFNEFSVNDDLKVGIIIIDSVIVIIVNISSVCKYYTKMVIYKVFKETEK